MMTLQALVVILLFSIVAVVFLSVQHSIGIGIKDISTQTMCLAVYRVRGAMSGGLGLMGFVWKGFTIDKLLPESPACGKIITVNPNRKSPFITNVTTGGEVNRRIASEIHDCWAKAEQDPGGKLFKDPIQCVYNMRFRLNGTGFIDECTITEVLGNKDNFQYKKTWQDEKPPGNNLCLNSDKVEHCACSERIAEIRLKDSNARSTNECEEWAPGGDHIDATDLGCIWQDPDENEKNEYAIRIYYDGGGDNGKIILRGVK